MEEVIIKELYMFQDKKYLDFQSKLTPNIEKEKFIGVRVPILRKFAKEYVKDKNIDIFLNDLPHKYYDENMLHALIISEIKDYETCIAKVEKFLPYVDNWAVCDIMSPKVFKNNKDKLINNVLKWVKSNNTYTCRFGIEMIMTYYLDENFKSNYLEMVSKIKTDEYYIKMVIAWFFATALAKKWNETISYLEENKLNIWIHNKTIQKARESYRITEKQKEYLKKLKR